MYKFSPDKIVIRVEVKQLTLIVSYHPHYLQVCIRIMCVMYTWWRDMCMYTLGEYKFTDNKNSNCSGCACS